MSTRSELRIKSNQEVKIDKLYKLWSESEYNEAINEALFTINSKWDWKWETQDKTTTGSTTASQQFYDKPTDYLGMKLVEFDDKELTRTEYEDVQRQYTDLPTWTPTYYYLYKDKIGLHPIPTQVGTLKLLYGTTITDLTDDTDSSPFAERFDRAIALYVAYVLLSQPADNRNLQRANAKLSRFNEEIIKLQKLFLYNDRENMQFKSNYIPRTQKRGYNPSYNIT